MFPGACGVVAAWGGGPGQWILVGARNTTLEMLGDYLTLIPGVSKRPIVDQTGLSGKYDFTLRWVTEANRPSSLGTAPQPPSLGPTFQDALREQLGLKLKPTNARVQVLVIDHIEMPSAN